MRTREKVIRSGGLLAIWLVGCSVGPAVAGESPWSMTGSLTSVETDASFGVRNTRKIDDEGSGASIALGYRISRHLAVQAGYHDLGSYRGFGSSPCPQEQVECIERLATLGLCVEGFDCAEVLIGFENRLSGFSVAAVPHWPVSERFSVRGKIGAMAWDSEITGPPGLGLTESFSGESLLLGAGVQYDFRNGLGILLEYDHFDLGVGSAALGLSWRF